MDTHSLIFEANAQLKAVRLLLLAADGDMEVGGYDLAMLLEPIALKLETAVIVLSNDKPPVINVLQSRIA